MDKKLIENTATALLNSLLTNDSLRHMALNQAEKMVYDSCMKKAYPVGIKEVEFIAGRNLLYAINKALDKGFIAPNVRKRLLKDMVGKVMLRKNSAIENFIKKYKIHPPGFLVISPTATCNLKCTGCYANSSSSEKAWLDFETFSRILTEKETLWGSYFTVISGGEPFLWKDSGHTILDIFEKHNNQYFMVYTNGTLIDTAMAKRLAELGNVSPAISIEGFESTTDARRGKGVFKKILKAFANLREAGVPFGVSLTATRENVDTIISDDFVDFCFDKQGAIYGWYFQYMPIGRKYTFDLLVTPEQRVRMYKKQMKLMREKKLFFVDFWNGGPMSHGCISGGRSGGFFYINWNGDITPCVFFPYSTANIYDIYKNGGDLNTAWDLEFFKDIRKWQIDYGFAPDCKNVKPEIGNWLRPCIMRDHHRVAYELIKKHNTKPVDLPAADAIKDEEYHRMLIEYGDRVGNLTEPIWEKYYLKK